MFSWLTNKKTNTARNMVEPLLKCITLKYMLAE